MAICDLLFGGKLKVQTALAAAVAAQRESLGISHSELDGMCGLGGKEGVPSSVDLEQNPSLITHKIFSRLMFPLQLKIDRILKPDWGKTRERMTVVLGEMKKVGARVAAGNGGDVRTISLEDQAKVYVLLKTLRELD